MAVADAGRLNVSRDRWYNNPLFRSIATQVVLVVVVFGTIAWFTNNTDHQSPRARYRVRLRLPMEARRLRYDDVPQHDVGKHLRLHAAGRAGRHDRCVGPRHRHRHDSRVDRRYCATVEQLADPHDRHHLRRILPQHPAADRHLVLVPGGHRGASRTSRKRSRSDRTSRCPTAASSCRGRSSGQTSISC